MANDQHMRWLQEGVPSWNERRECDPFTPDLSNVFFPDFFAETNQRDANGGVQLSGVNLAGADLSGAFITDADFTNADFSNATLRLAFGMQSNLSQRQFCRGGVIHIYGRNRRLF